MLFFQYLAGSDKALVISIVTITFANIEDWLGENGIIVDENSQALAHQPPTLSGGNHASRQPIANPIKGLTTQTAAAVVHRTAAHHDKHSISSASVLVASYREYGVTDHSMA